MTARGRGKQPNGKGAVAMAVLFVASMASAFAAEAAAASPGCDAPLTTAAMRECAYEEFLVASEAMAQATQGLRERLPPARSSSLLRMQKAWLAYRTEACRFEATAAQGGSLAPVLQWRCAARLTRERAQALADQ